MSDIQTRITLRFGIRDINTNLTINPLQQHTFIIFKKVLINLDQKSPNALLISN